MRGNTFTEARWWEDEAETDEVEVQLVPGIEAQQLIKDEELPVRAKRVAAIPSAIPARRGRSTRAAPPKDPEDQPPIPESSRLVPPHGRKNIQHVETEEEVETLKPTSRRQDKSVTRNLKGESEVADVSLSLIIGTQIDSRSRAS